MILLVLNEVPLFSINLCIFFNPHYHFHEMEMTTPVLEFSKEKNTSSLGVYKDVIGYL